MKLNYIRLPFQVPFLDSSLLSHAPRTLRRDHTCGLGFGLEVLGFWLQGITKGRVAG